MDGLEGMIAGVPGGATQNGTLALIEDLFTNVFLLFGTRARGWLPPRFDATYAKGERGSMWAKHPVPRAWKDKNGNWGRGSNHLQTGYGLIAMPASSSVIDPDAVDRVPDVNLTQ